MNEAVYFIAEHPTIGRTLWRTRLPSLETGLVSPYASVDNELTILPVELTHVRDTLVFASWPLSEPETAPKNVELGLIRDEGGELHVLGFHEIRPGDQGSWPRQLTRAGEQVFFTANDGRCGEELWVTDGTLEGTRLVKDILVPGDLTPFP